VISEGEETECADDIWNYYEAHKDELEDLDEYASKRGLVKCFRLLNFDPPI